MPRKGSKPGLIRLICTVCSGEFFDYPYRADWVTCGRDCRAVLQRGRKTGPRSPETIAKISATKQAFFAARKVTRTCSDCGVATVKRGVRCRSCSARARASTPESREAMRQKSLSFWSDPSVRQRMVDANAASHRTDEFRALSSALMKELRNRPEIAERLQGPNHPNWVGGTHEFNRKRINTTAWKKFSRQYRRDHPNICDVCKGPAKIPHHRIPVRLWPEGEFLESNIQLLCQPCHSRIEAALRRTERAQGLGERDPQRP